MSTCPMRVKQRILIYFFFHYDTRFISNDEDLKVLVSLKSSCERDQSKWCYQTSKVTPTMTPINTQTLIHCSWDLLYQLKQKSPHDNHDNSQVYMVAG